MSSILGYKVQAVFTSKDRADAEDKFREVGQALAGKDFTVLVLACMDDDSELVMISNRISLRALEEQPQIIPPAKLPRKLKKKLHGTRKNPR